MAAIQIGVIVYGLSVARRLNRLLVHVEQQVTPLSESINAIARDAARVTSLATGQMERLDGLVTDMTNLVEQTSTTVHAILKPLRDGAAVLSGVKTAIGVFLQFMRPSDGNRGRTDDDDALFIG